MSYRKFKLLKKCWNIVIILLINVFLVFSFSNISYQNNSAAQTFNYKYSQNKVLNGDFDIPEEIYESFRNLITELKIDSENSPLFLLMKKINEDLNPGIEYTVVDAIKDNENLLKPKLVDQLFLYNQQHPEKWTLNLSGSDWNNLDLKLLDAFSVFSNINQVVINVAKDSNINVAFNFLTLKDFSLIKNLQYISKAQISFEDPTYFLNTRSFSFERDFKFLEDVSGNFQSLDISTFFTSTNQPAIEGDFLNEEWFINLKYDFEFYLPWSMDVPVSINEEYIVENMSEVYAKKLTKKTAQPIPLPTTQKHDNIFIDGNEIEAFLYENNWYWILEDVNTLMDVDSYNVKTGEYNTHAKIGGDYIRVAKRTSTYDKNMDKEHIDKLFLNTPVQSFNLNHNNVDILDKDILINGKKYDYKVESSIAYLNFDIDDIKFANENKTKFFTDVSEITTLDWMDKITSTHKNENNEITTVTPINLPKPNSYEEKLMIDKIEVSAIVVDNNFYWNLENQNLDHIRYYSPELNYLFSNIDAIKSLNSFPTDLTEFGDLEEEQLPITNSLHDLGLLTTDNFGEILNTISIDGETIDQIIRNGYVYWNYSHIENVNLVVENKNNADERWYFSNYENAYKCWNKDPSNYVINSIIPIAERLIPPPFEFSLPTVVSKDEIIIAKNNDKNDNYIYYVATKVLRNGDFYWNIDNKNVNLEGIQYIDSNGLYYISLIDSIVPEGISNVNISKSQAEIPGVNKSFFAQNNSGKITIDNYQIYNSGIIIDDIYYNFKFLDSKVLIDKNAPVGEIQYIINFEDINSNKFLTNLKEYNLISFGNLSETESFTFDIYDENTNFPFLQNPKSISDPPISFINDLGEISIINPIELENDGKTVIGYDNPLIKGANYLLEKSNGDLIYANLLNDITLVDVVKISSLQKNELLYFPKSKVEIGNPRTHSDVALYITIGSIGAVVLTMLTQIGIFILRWNKKGGI